MHTKKEIARPGRQRDDDRESFPGSWYPVHMSPAISSREADAQRGKRLEYFTIAWNSVEGLLAVVAGAIAGSISLIGFGIDSFIEVASGATLLWRMNVDADARSRERNERISLLIVGICFMALSLYLGYESLSDLIGKKAPQHSIPGIILACASLVVMPVLSRAKKRVGTALGSAAMTGRREADRLLRLSIRYSAGRPAAELWVWGGGGPIPWAPSLWCLLSGRRGLKASGGRAAPILATELWF